MDRLHRTRLLFGDIAMEKLANSTVMVVGCGAVGSFVIEALARTGVGNLILIDFDNVEESNKEERYIKSMISFPQEGINISLFGIETIEKDFRIKESNYGGENVTVQYGIVINKDMEPSMRYPRVNVDVWFDSEEVRDQRYENMLTKLKQAGFKFIDV